MSFLPARMTRVLVGGHKDRMEAAIAALHAEGAVHIEDFQDPTGTTRIGSPLPAGDKASAALVAVRGLRKALGAEGFPATNHVAVAADPARAVQEAQAASRQALDAAAEAKARIAALEAEAQALRPIAGLDVDLGAARSLSSVKVLLGIARTDPLDALRASGLAHEADAAPAPNGYAVAVAVASKDAAAAERILSEHGFVAAALPAGNGTPAARLSALAAAQQKARADLSSAEAKLAALRDAWGPALASAESALAAEVERTQAPLRFGVTESTFHLEGWVPASRATDVEAAIRAKLGGKVYVEQLGDAPEPEHGLGMDEPDEPLEGVEGEELAGLPVAHAASGEPAPESEPAGLDLEDLDDLDLDELEDEEHGGEHHGTDPKDEPPVQLENPRLAKPYEFLLGLLGKPRYGEVDPTKLMLLFFPLFFGLMVGDVVVGLVIMGVGAALKTRKLFGIGGPAVGRALFAGGVVSVVVGAFVFGEALGIHFVTPPATPDHAADMSWESVLHLHVPYSNEPHGFLYRTGTLAGCLAEQANEGGGGNPLAPHSSCHLTLGGIVNLGYYSKIHDIEALLVWAVILGLAHLILGFALGVRNVYVSHGATLAIQEKASWLGLIGGTALAVLGLATHTIGAFWGGVGVGLVVISLILLWIATQKVLGAGFVALLEALGLVGNLLSYTRLAAIGASKAGMVIALNAIGFTIAGGGVLGWAIYVLGFALIIPLAILSAGLQSLRLQFVEFFQKFYTGGGRPYVPFGRRAA